MRCLRPGLACLLLVACGESAPPAPSAPPDRPEAPVEDVEAPAPAPSRSPAGPEAIAVGFEAIPAPPSREVTRALREALAAHRSGDVSASRDAFAAIVEAHPDYDAARFDLACALARLGELERAAQELMTVLRRDLPEYRRKLDEDEDLRALRDSPHGDRIREEIDALDARWRRAADVGVPAVAWRESGRASSPRAGVYLVTERRFIPLGPHDPSSNAALADPRAGKVLLITFDSDRGRAHVEVHPLFGVRGAIASQDLVAVQLEIHATEAGARYRATREAMGVLLNQAWHDLTPTGAGARSADQSPPGRPYLTGWRRLALQSPGCHDVAGGETRLGELALRGNTLRPAEGEPIQLGRGHGAAQHSALSRSPDQRVVFVASTACRREECTHVIDRVDLADRSVTRLGSGDGPAAVHVAPDGRTLVQRGAALQVLPRFDADPSEAEPALEGVFLVSPE